ncbi:EAL domain-containing protein [Pseudomonas aeruginosa]|nr:EAL domain-containing protein [Pseudomonas aeruginosa]
MRQNRTLDKPRLLGLVWPFIVVVLLQAMLAGGSLYVLSAVRSYVGGESLWSKGQKDAIYYLTLYADSRADEDFRRYEEAIAIPLGDREMRLALDQPDPDIEAARQGILKGGNHADDVTAIIWLYRNFHDFSYFERAIELWLVGDKYVMELIDVAGKMRAGIGAGQASAEQVQQWKTEIHAINEKVTPAAKAFSDALGEGSRALLRLLLVANLTTASVLILLAFLRTRQQLMQRQEVENALDAERERAQITLASIGDGVITADTQGGISYLNPAAEQMTNWTLDKARGLPLASLFRIVDESSREEGMLLIEQILSGEIDGGREHSKLVLRERAQITLASIGDGVITADTQGGISYLNPAAEQMTNWTLDKARGLPLASLFRIVDESSREEGMLLIEQILSGEIDGGREHSKLVLRHDGSSVPVTLVGAPIHRGGEITGVVLVLHDMTRERQYMARLSWQATHDALTGLTNRREFEYRLQIALERLERNSGRHALMFLDLDQFKLVNDTCGHAAGDELLRQVCTLLQQGLREGDTLARLGGDEFGILLENCPAEKAVEIADHLRKTIQDLHFTWSGQPFNCTVSVGLVHLLPGISTLEEALRSADMACYMAKEKGRNRVQVFHQDDVELSMRFGEMTWVQRIHLALEEDRFSLYAQPIVPLGEGAEEGLHVELLLRLRDEGGRLVPPLSFIPAAERYGLMTLIDRWVVENAFRTLVERAQDPRAEPIGTCAINLSGATIGDESFLQFLTELFARYRIPPQTICFEVTETVAVANLASAIRFINELKDTGCRFSLDDFCAGMSSFIYLKHLPVDYLKIDGSFVKDMLEDPIDRAMVQVINHIGHVMGKRTIAEFVETVEVMEALREIGIDYAQGLAIGAPLPFSRQPPGAGVDAQGLWPSLGQNLR